MALKNGLTPILRRLSDQLVLRHDQQKSIEIKICKRRPRGKWLRSVVWRLTLAAARFMRRSAREKHAGSGLARAGTESNFYFLSPRAGARLYLPKPASRGIFPPC
jgi:hypothetical protein